MCKFTYPLLDSAVSKVEESERIDARIIIAVMSLPIFAAFAVIWMVITWTNPQPHQITNLLTGQEAKVTFSDASLIPERIKKAEVELKKTSKQGIHKPE
ncbi:MAG: hypothetical protein HGA71_08390 [Azonexaceae bacterium]|nr:hypothetical protein [Azonexaceae bacterium]